MACASLGMSASSPAATARDTFGSSIGGLRRSRSEPVIMYSLKVAHSTAPPQLKTSRSVGSFGGFSIPSPIRSFFVDSEDVTSDAMRSVTDEIELFTPEANASKRMPNWVQRICEVRNRWRDRHAKDSNSDEEEEAAKWEDYQCSVSYESEEEAEREKEEWGPEAFGRLLSRASLPETKLFSKLAFLCNMAYAIPQMKGDDLGSYYGLRLVTSSLDKKQEAAAKAKHEEAATTAGVVREPETADRPARSSLAAYQLAASAASYIRNRAKGLLSPREKAGGVHECRAEGGANQGEGRSYTSKLATYVAASSVTAVVAAEEKARMEAARDLQSLHSSPCEWFVCDEPSSCTRCFVIQGSDSLSSWQTNLFFEPTEFEGTTALVHRGIYEAAKGIYHQFMPEIESHFRALGSRARFRFTGHSLGGSLSLLICLMLLARGVVPRSALRPVVTFGSPAVFCGGARALDALGLDGRFIRAVMMHRDIVPRAFSCNYPGHVVRFLERLNRSFRSHACLNDGKLLYAPLGRQYILQPDDKASPPHPLLPPGAALYFLDANNVGAGLRTFMNTPHPLETLSHPTAYGSEGTISRDHDSCNYLFAVNALLRQQTLFFFRRSRRQRLTQWLPFFTARAEQVSVCS